MDTVAQAPRMHGRTRTLVLAALLAMVFTAVGISPAEAKSSFAARTSGSTAEAYWTHVDGTPTGSPSGNVHVGWLYAYETSEGRAEVFGFVDDFDCDEGEDPWWDECEYAGFRFIDGYGVPFQIDKKLTSAHLSGTLSVFNENDGSSDVVQADISWTGEGGLTRERHTYRYKDGDTTYSSTYRAQVRSASVDGSIGSATLDADTSGGSLTSFTSSDKSKTK